MCLTSFCRALRRVGVEFKVVQRGERYAFFNCSKGQHRACAVLVVNGLSDVPVDEHEAEDHLLALVRALNYSSDIPAAGSSKEAWIALSKGLGLKPHRLLAEAISRGPLMQRVMPQHCEAFEKAYGMLKWKPRFS